MKNPFSALVLALVFAGCASRPPEPLNIENRIEASATVTQIDAARRTMTLRTDDGRQDTVEVAPAVRNLDQVKVGDRVTVTYYEAIGAAMRKPGDATDASVDLGAGRAEPGQRPGGVVAAVQTLPVTIVSVDAKTHTVQFYGQDRQVRQITVKTPEAQAYVARLKAGDEVIVTYTEALAVEVKPAR